jgi:hypothetical protein
MPEEIESESDQDPETEEELFSFLIEDQQVVSNLIAAVRSLLQRPELPPQTISEIGVFLFALERLPAPTPGICATLSLDYELNREKDWISIQFESDCFRLNKGFYTYEPGVGGDTHSEIILEVGIGWRDGDTFEAVEFAESFASCAEDACREVNIEQNADEPFNDWDLESDPDAWGRLDSDYL